MQCILKSNQIILFQATRPIDKYTTDKQTDRNRQKHTETHKHTKITNALICS